MNHEELVQAVLDAVRSQAGAGDTEIQLETSLGVDGLGIDSIGCLYLVLELEQRTGIRLRDETLTAAALATPAALIDHLARSERG